MRHQMNLAALNDLPIEQKRTHVFNAIKGALALMPIAIDVLGTQAALKYAANDPALIGRNRGGVVTEPSLESVKAYLTSDGAAKHFGGQKWAVPSDAPAVVQTANRVIQFMRDNLPSIDLGYTSLFKLVDMRGATTDTVDVATTSSGVKFEQTEYGGQIKLARNIGVNETALKMLTFTGGRAILDDWLNFNKWYKVEDAITDIQLGYAKNQMDLHYGLIKAVGAGSNVAFDTDLATTYNKALAGLMRKLDAKGYVLGSTLEVDIVVSPENVGKVLAMLEATRGSAMVAFGGQKQPITSVPRNIIVTTQIASNDNNFYVVVPERKLVRAVWKDLTVETERAADYRATDWYAHGQFNSVLGEPDQVARVALS